jgi:uncharacterized protein YndB with AHSA1/START domain
MDHGTYLELDGRPAVRFERQYPHPIERVWSSISTTEGLGHWFPATVTIDLRVGGEVLFGGDPHTDDHAGTVLACDPPHRLAFTWGGDEVHLELEELGRTGCRVVLVNVLERRDAAARNAAGWSVCLAELDRYQAGGVAAGPHSASALPWQPFYESYVAAGLPSGAPIPDPA